MGSSPPVGSGQLALNHSGLRRTFMAIRVHFVGGGEVLFEDETVKGFSEHVGSDPEPYVHYKQEDVLIVVPQVTFVEGLDDVGA